MQVAVQLVKQLRRLCQRLRKPAKALPELRVLPILCLRRRRFRHHRPICVKAMMDKARGCEVYASGVELRFGGRTPGSSIARNIISSNDDNSR